MLAQGRWLAAFVVLIKIYGLGCCGDGQTANPVGTKQAQHSPTNPSIGKRPPPTLEHAQFPSALAAVEQILARTRPRVIGFGEFHQQQGTAQYLSTLERFSAELLPALASRTSDLVVEAWVSDGDCGETEQAVVSEVERISKRPATTQDENISLLKRARQLGVRPHILSMSCQDYLKVYQGDAGTDYVAMLELVATRIEEKTKSVLASANDTATQKLVAILGGAIHNDVRPDADWKTFAYGPRLQRATNDAYVEIDLYVPEFILVSETAREEDWFPLVERLAAPDKASLIKRGPNSYIVLFRMGVPNTNIVEKGGGDDHQRDSNPDGG